MILTWKRRVFSSFSEFRILFAVRAIESCEQDSCYKSKKQIQHHFIFRPTVIYYIELIISHSFSIKRHSYDLVQWQSVPKLPDLLHFPMGNERFAHSLTQYCCLPASGTWAQGISRRFWIKWSLFTQLMRKGINHMNSNVLSRAETTTANNAIMKIANNFGFILMSNWIETLNDDPF